MRRLSVSLFVGAAAAGALIASGAIAARGSAPVARQASAGAAGLLSRLAVLRRPQTSADMLPSPVTWGRPAPENGPIIGSLTRLVATPPGMQIYLVVTQPSTAKGAFWKPKYGDQVAIVGVSAAGATETAGRPAADLSDGLQVGGAGAPALGGPGYAVGVVPDGVATVRWTFANRHLCRGATVTVAASNNVAYLPYSQVTGPVLAARWYAADGTAVPTSHRALLQVTAARQAGIRTRILLADSRIKYRPSPAILQGFQVFSVDTITPTRVAGGLTIQAPVLRTVPLAILSITRPRPLPPQAPPLARWPQMVPRDMREVTTASGYRIWVVPARQGLCMFTVSPPRLPGLGAGAGGSCSGSVASALKSGTGGSGPGPGGRVTVQVLPTAHPTITVRSAGRQRMITPPYGIYVAFTPGHGCGAGG